MTHQQMKEEHGFNHFDGGKALTMIAMLSATSAPTRKAGKKEETRPRLSRHCHFDAWS
jgi:hypothetical protein